MEMLYYATDISRKYNFNLAAIRRIAAKLYPEKQIYHKRIRYTENEAEAIYNARIKNKPNSFIIKSDNTAIMLVGNKEVLIDSDKIDLLSKIRWSVLEKYIGYRNIEKNITIYLHRYLIKAPVEKIVDHINGNRLDNRLINLRLCDYSQNQYNKGLTKANKSGYKGVYWHKTKKKWATNISANKKQYYLGCFDTPEAAYAAYCEKAKELHGEFARLA